MSKLRIASDLTLPLEATTQAIGIVAKRRVGKSYTARRIAEQLLKAGQQIVIADPKGDWWGIRSSADGKAAGYPVTILGGEHGDLPLEASAGEVVAKLVVEERVSVLLDLSQFRKAEVARFMADFLETLYRLKAKEANRTPVMVIIDEADAIAPQKPQPGEERMLGAAEDIVRRGGQRGIGCMMITQRTAVLNKNVLTQCEMLIALRTISPQDLKAMQAWIDVHGSEEERDTLMGSLPSLPQGDAWFWSPGWPTADGIFQRVHVLPIETFDSGATPKSGEKRIEPKSSADVDLAALKRQMAATIEKARADDPKELRREIARLKAENVSLSHAKAKAPAAVRPDNAAIEQAVNAARATWTKDLRRIIGKDVSRLAAAVDRTTSHLTNLERSLKDVTACVLAIDADLSPEQVKAPAAAASDTEIVRKKTSEGGSVAWKHTPSTKPTPAAPSSLSRGQQKVLNALAELEVLGVSRPSRHQLGMVAGYNLTGGSGAQHVADLTQMGFAGNGDGVVWITDEGRAHADAGDAPSTLDELHERVLAKLSDGQRRIAEHLISIYPNAISRADLGEATNYNLTGGSGAQHVADLVTVGAAKIPAKGEVVASDLLFPESLS